MSGEVGQDSRSGSNPPPFPLLFLPLWQVKRRKRNVEEELRRILLTTPLPTHADSFVSQVPAEDIEHVLWGATRIMKNTVC